MTPREQPPRILAIIVNWNKCEYLRNLLQSLRTLEGTPFEILVVDNASGDGSPEMIRTEFPEVTLLETGDNLGGTGGFNAGMTWGLNHSVSYDYFWLMDNDIVVHPGALDGLLDAMNTDPQIALVGSTILVLEEPGRVQEIGARIDWSSCTPIRNAEGPFKRVKRPRIYEADYVAACSCLARVPAIRKVGIWDPAYFVQWDDMEWGLRFKRAGYRVAGTTESQVRHESFDARRATQGPTLIYLTQRNVLHFSRGQAPFLHRPLLLFKQFRLALVFAANYELDQRPREANAHRTAVRDFIEGRMGKPSFAELNAVTNPDTRQTAIVNPAEIRRIGLLTWDNPEFTRTMHGVLRSEFPRAVIDTLVIDPKDTFLREKFPRRRVFRLPAVHHRLKVARLLATRYDAVASAEYVPNFFFKECAPAQIRIFLDGTWTARRRTPARLARFIWKRVGCITAAIVCAARTLSKPKAPVDYHHYRK